MEMGKAGLLPWPFARDLRLPKRSVSVRGSHGSYQV